MVVRGEAGPVIVVEEGDRPCDGSWGGGQAL